MPSDKYLFTLTLDRMAEIHNNLAENTMADPKTESDRFSIALVYEGGNTRTISLQFASHA